MDVIGEAMLAKKVFNNLLQCKAKQSYSMYLSQNKTINQSYKTINQSYKIWHGYSFSHFLALSFMDSVLFRPMLSDSNKI